MDRRTLIALMLTAAVIVVTPIIFPAPPRRPVDTTAIDSTAAPSPSQAQPAVSTPTPAATPTQARPQVPAQTQTQTAVREDTTTVTTQHAVYRFSSFGATPVAL